MKEGRNLILLGAIAIIIAIATSSLALTIYHNTGDIYLDRSRPGFLPDKTESIPEEYEYTFSEAIELNQASLEKYLKEYQKLLSNLHQITDPFSMDPLSDATVFGENDYYYQNH